MINVLLNRIYFLYNIKFLSLYLIKGIYIIFKFFVIVICIIIFRYLELVIFVFRFELFVLMIRSVFGYLD